MQEEYAWIFVYWMPYDNSLWVYGQTILDMIVRGAQSAQVLVAVISDLRREDSLTRRLIADGRVVDAEDLTVSDSSSAEIYADNLDWLRSRFSARHWAHVFLGHGGRLDEICPDEHTAPGPGSAVQWMKIQDLASVLETHNRSVGGQLELLFLQNCCKGTLEVVYSFRRAARYTLASQAKVGAPNGYYERLFLFVGEDPEITGVELAARIVAFERDDMYNSLSLLDNQALGDLAAKLDPLVDAIVSRGVPAYLTWQVPRLECADEVLVDSLPFLRSVVEQVGADKGPLRDFEAFLTKDLIVRHDESPMTKHPGLCGLNLFMPDSSEYLDRYRYLDVYRETGLSALFDVVS